MCDKENEASYQDKSLTIRVKARITSLSNTSDDVTTLTLEIGDKVVRDEKTYYGYEIISEASNTKGNTCNSQTAILSAFSKNSFDDLKGQNLYLYSTENTIKVADPCVSEVWQQMLISMCKNHIFTFVLEFKNGTYALKKVEF